MTLSVKPGLSAPIVTSIPREWDAEWFRRFITNYLTNADIRNATAGPGIKITGNPTTVGTVATNLSLSNLPPIPNNAVLGNISGIPAPPVALSKPQLTDLVNQFTSSLSGDVPGSGGGTANFLRADGTWQVPPGTASSPIVINQSLGGEADLPEDPLIIPGPPGQTGAQGSAGAPGPTGGPGMVLFLEPEPGDEGPLGPPGLLGLSGIGIQGRPGFDGADGEDAWIVPGPQGPQGLQGAPGPVFYFEPDIEDALTIPGPQGLPGTAFVVSSPVFLEAELGEDSIMVPGPQGQPGLSTISNNLPVFLESDLPEDQITLQTVAMVESSWSRTFAMMGA